MKHGGVYMQTNELSNIKLLKEIAEFLNEETEMEKMLQGALRKLLEGTIFETGWIFFIDEKGKQNLKAHVNLPVALKKKNCMKLEKGGCWCVSRFQTEKLNKASNIIECKRIDNTGKTPLEANGGITHHATVPLQSGKERFGLLNVATPNTIRFDERELALLESVAFQIGSAVKRILLTKQEQQVALVQERNRLARDLHDSVNQLLFSVTLTARGGIEMTEQQELKDTFKEIQYLTQDALTEMRALIWQLRPKGLETGIIEGLKGYGDILGLTLNVHVKGVIKLPANMEEVLFRITQEALNNVRKHAGVLQADLYLTVTSTDILLVVKDEGCGFQMSTSNRLPSIGLQSMKDRANSVGGTVDWVSEWNKGTEILVRLPY